MGEPAGWKTMTSDVIALVDTMVGTVNTVCNLSDFTVGIILVCILYGIQ